MIFSEETKTHLPVIEGGSDYVTILTLVLLEAVSNRHSRLELVLVAFIVDDRAVFRIPGHSIVIHIGDDAPRLVDL